MKPWLIDWHEIRFSHPFVVLSSYLTKFEMPQLIFDSFCWVWNLWDHFRSSSIWSFVGLALSISSLDSIWQGLVWWVSSSSLSLEEEESLESELLLLEDSEELLCWLLAYQRDIEDHLYLVDMILGVLNSDFSEILQNGVPSTTSFLSSLYYNIVLLVLLYDFKLLSLSSRNGDSESDRNSTGISFEDSSFTI